MLATLAGVVPADESNWTYELKYDGFRMVAHGIDGGQRQRIYRLRPNQLFHIDDVAIFRILSAGASPQRPLHARSCTL